MLVSVIIGIYNGEKFISKIYDNLCRQTFTDFQLIFSNDASTDKTLEMLEDIKKNDDRVLVISSKNNNGPGGAKNEAIKYANGKYLAFLDCDDYISDNYLEELVKSAKENNFPDIVISNFVRINSDGSSKLRDYTSDYVAYKQNIANYGKLYKRDLIDNNDLMIPYFNVIDDLLFNLSVKACNPSFYYNPTPKYYYVFNSNSVVNTTLLKFPKNSTDISVDYLRSLISNEKLDYNILNGNIFKFACWHLLKLGNNVGNDSMMIESEKLFNFIRENFPNYRKVDLKGERFVLQVVVRIMLLLDVLGLLNAFLKIYANIDLKRFWPTL